MEDEEEEDFIIKEVQAYDCTSINSHINTFDCGNVRDGKLSQNSVNEKLL